jgi:ParB-like chromosome segregation protein Spo0J
MISAVDVKVDPVYAALVPPLSKEEYENLKNSIREDGLLAPIIVNQNGTILDGHHRNKACWELGLSLTDRDVLMKRFVDKLLEKKFVITTNLRRRQLSDIEKVKLAIPLIEIERELAKRRQGTRTDLGRTFPSNEGEVAGEATAIVAKEVGLSKPTLERGIVVLQRAPELIKAKVQSTKMSISKGYETTLTYENLKSPNLRDLVGPDMAAELARLKGDALEAAKLTTLTTKPKLGLEEVHYLVERMIAGATADQATNEIKAKQKDARSQRYKEVRNLGISRVPCVTCERVLRMKHLKNGRHRVLKDEGI